MSGGRDVWRHPPPLRRHAAGGTAGSGGGSGGAKSGRLADLANGFTVTQWESGRRAVYSADPNAPGGRPFLDGIEIQMGRRLKDQGIALNLGKADMVESDPSEPQRPGNMRRGGRRRRFACWHWFRSPQSKMRAFGRRWRWRWTAPSIHSVLLQRQGEISGALLPQWLSGYAFLFPAAADVPRARAVLAGVPAAGARRSPSVWQIRPNRRIADRIALNARDAGLTVTLAPPSAPADVRLVELRIASADPAAALADMAPRSGCAERRRAPTRRKRCTPPSASLLEGFRVIPLFHLPDVYGVGPRVKGGPGITPLGEWRFENLWVEGGRP